MQQSSGDVQEKITWQRIWPVSFPNVFDGYCGQRARSFAVVAVGMLLAVVMSLQCDCFRLAALAHDYCPRRPAQGSDFIAKFESSTEPAV